jgi:hypothetical protein
MNGGWRWFFGALALVAALTARAGAGEDLALRSRAAAGGDGWLAVVAVASSGTVATGGLDGRLESLERLADGHSVARFDLGPVRAAQGFDGRAAWSQDPGGEVAAQDSPDAVAQARSEAWIAARGYWFPDRLGARWGVPRRVEREGRALLEVAVQPEGGLPVQLAYDAVTGLPARAQLGSGQGRLGLAWSDWREVEGLRQPFHVVSERGAEVAERTVVVLERVTTVGAAEDAAFAPPAMAARASLAGPEGTGRIRVRVVNNHLLARADIDGHAATVIVDTGGANVLTPEAARRFGLAAAGKLAGRGVGSARVDVALAPARRLRLGDLDYRDPTFYVMDLGRLAEFEGEPIDGIVGHEMFRRFAVTIDYGQGELRLSTPERFVAPAGATRLALRFSDRTPLIEGELDGLPVTISVDTGSRSTFTVHGPFAREHALAERYRAAPASVSGWGVGGAALGREIVAGRLRLGNLELREVPGQLFAGERGAFMEPGIGLNLGGGVLRRFVVAFDYAGGAMYLRPTDATAQRFARDRTGLWLGWKDGALEVAAVADGSAAATAGFVPGDRIVAVDGEPAAARSLSDWRELLAARPEGTHVALTVAGIEQPREVVLRDRARAVADVVRSPARRTN